MEKIIQNKILKHYNDLFQKFGDNPASIGWPKGRQDIRFKVVTEIGDLKNSKILDVGCGFGDFASYLKKNRIKAEYHGIDINSNFIKIAKQKHPNKKFSVRDLEKVKFKNKFDWICAIGATNAGGTYRYIEKLLKEMFRISKKGIVMDFMSTYVDFKDKDDFHVSPERIFKIAKKLSKRVVIRHDYLPFEFCVYIYKNEKLTNENKFLEFN